MEISNKKSIEELVNLREKRILVRCDFNVPLIPGTTEIADTKRIDETLPTINYLIKNDAKVILCSHFGRPKGVYNEKLSLRPVCDYLSKVLKQDVIFVGETVGESAKKVINSMQSGHICLLENLRFFAGEEKNDTDFAKQLADLADIFVNDAFGTAHRTHASTVGVTQFLPSVYGFLMKKEIEIMNKVLNNPKRPFVSILGGSKVSDKIGVINSLLEKIDILIVGGGMAYTFINALGYSTGTSISEPDKIPLAKEIIAKTNEKNVKFYMPVDNKVAREYKSDAEFKVVEATKIPDDWMGLDVGTETQRIFSEVIKTAGTVVWNGTMGVAEWDNFAEGTMTVAKAIAESNAISVIGGGDSAAAVKKLGLTEKMSHVSTGGGASLMLLEGKDLPAVTALSNK